MRAGLLPAVLLAACASREPAGPARMVQSRDLPARHREVLELCRRGGAEWELERARAASDPGLARFLVDNLVIDMVRAFERARIAGAGEPSGPFERAQGELVDLACHSTPLLVELLAVKDGVVAFLAADTLARIGEPALAPVSALLDAHEDATRRRAAELLGQLPPGASTEAGRRAQLARLAVSDPAWIVRAETVRALALRAVRSGEPDTALPTLVRALADPDVSVARAACRAAALLADPRAAPALSACAERATREGLPALLAEARAALAAVGSTPPR